MLKLQYFGHLMQSRLIGKDPDTGKDWGQEEKWVAEEEKGVAEDEMIGWHHRLNGHEFGRQWRTEEPGMLQFMGLQRVEHELVTKQQQGFKNQQDTVSK